MYRDVAINNTLLVTVLLCSAMKMTHATQKYSEFPGSRQYSVAAIKSSVYNNSLVQLHSGLSEAKIYKLVAKQDGKDLITTENIGECSLSELVVLPGKRYLLRLRTVVELILRGYRYNPFTREPFTTAFCKALSSVVSINCTERFFFQDTARSEKDFYDWLLEELCAFYLRPCSKGLIQDVIPLLRVDEREEVHRRVKRILVLSHNAILGPSYNRALLKNIFVNIAAMALVRNESDKLHAFYTVILKRIMKGCPITSDMLDIVQKNWIMPFERACEVLNDKNALLDYGMRYEYYLRNLSKLIAE